MLPNHAPLAVAERFGMLEALHPDRIDLGLGRAPGTDMRTALALRSTSPELFEEQFAQLRGHLGSGYGGMRAVAGEHTVPELWMLGSTDGGARIAAKLGLPFVFAHHFHPHFTEPALELYRGLFEPSELADAPRTIVAAGIVVGDDDEDALRRALPGGVVDAAPAPGPARADPQRRGRRGARAPARRAASSPSSQDAIGRAIVGGAADRPRASCSTSSSARAPTSSCSSRRSPTPISASRAIERIARGVRARAAARARPSARSVARTVLGIDGPALLVVVGGAVIVADGPADPRTPPA